MTLYSRSEFWELSNRQSLPSQVPFTILSVTVALVIVEGTIGISTEALVYLRKMLFNVMGIYLKCAPQDEPVFQFLDRKRSEGKPFYVYMTAASNKFLRRYYAKVWDYLATLEDLPPVDMDSTGLPRN